MSNVNAFKLGQLAKPDKRAVDNLASHITIKLNLQGYEKFVCKAIYRLGSAKVADIAERAKMPDIKKPGHYFTYSCKKEMQNVG